jgi:hypothetical protein
VFIVENAARFAAYSRGAAAAAQRAGLALLLGVRCLLSLLPCVIADENALKELSETHLLSEVEF